MEGLRNNFGESRGRIMPPEAEELLAEEEEIIKGVNAAEAVVESSRHDLALTGDSAENQRYRDTIDRLNDTPEGKEILEAFFDLEDEVMSIMEKFLNGQKGAERAISLLVHAHREIKRMRNSSPSGK